MVRLMNHTANRERFRETMRYRRRLLSNQRTYWFNRAAAQIQINGHPTQKTRRRIRQIERQIREFNDLATEIDLRPIRT